MEPLLFHLGFKGRNRGEKVLCWGAVSLQGKCKGRGGRDGERGKKRPQQCTGSCSHSWLTIKPCPGLDLSPAWVEGYSQKPRGAAGDPHAHLPLPQDIRRVSPLPFDPQFSPGPHSPFSLPLPWHRHPPPKPCQLSLHPGFASCLPDSMHVPRGNRQDSEESGWRG